MLTFVNRVDDIEDNSPLRRGSPTAHVAYGVAPTINSANYVYFLTLNKTAKLADDMGADREKMVSIFVDEMLELHRGQGMEIWWRQNRVPPTTEQYLIMVERSMLLRFKRFDLITNHFSFRNRRSPATWRSIPSVSPQCPQEH